MPSHADNLARVRAACLKLRFPDLLENGCICSDTKQCAFHKGTERFDPTLPDVLLALRDSDNVEGYQLDVDSWEIRKSSYSKVIGAIRWRKVCVWNPRLPLSGQTPETVAYLAKLL